MLIVLILLFLLALAALALFIAARLILNKIFGSRCEGNPNITYFQSSDFPGLRRCIRFDIYSVSIGVPDGIPSKTAPTAPP